MNKLFLGGTVGAALLLGVGWLWCFPTTADGQRPAYSSVPRDAVGEGIIAMPYDLDERRQQLTVIDPVSHALAVYHIDKSSGEVSLRSVRNLHWDLQMEEFNGKSPSPREIRSLLSNR